MVNNRSFYFGIFFFLSASFCVKGEVSQEQLDRSVDRAAIASQKEAIHSLNTLIKKYKGTAKEAELLFKVSEVYHQSSEMAFRISYGMKRSKFSSQSKSFLRSSIEPLSQLIQKYPNYHEISKALLMRGRAYESIDSNSKAKSDYLKVVSAHSKAFESIPAAMAVARIEYNAKNYSQAVKFYKIVESKGETVFLPYALHELAWTYSLMGNARQAVQTTYKTIHILNKRSEKGDLAFRDEVLKDSATFYFEGFRKTPKSYPIENAYEFFKKLDEGSVLGSMLLRYGTFLRAYDDSQVINSWLHLVSSKEFKREETLSLLVLVFEYQLNKKLYSYCARTSQLMAQIAPQFKGSEDVKKTETILLQATLELQKRMVSYKGSVHSQRAAQYLSVVYESFITLVGPKDSRIRIVRANLAEAYFAIEEYEKATENYRWIVENGSWSEKQNPTTFTVTQASERAISSRYELLLKLNKIPKNLNAVALPSRDIKDAEKPVRDLVRWIDTHEDKTDKTLEHFQFESNRALYAQGRINEAVERLERFALNNPHSSFAIPSATLVMDTYIATQNWALVEKQAQKFLVVQSWSRQPFYTKLKETAANAKYKQAENALAQKDNKSAFKHAVEFSEEYSSHSLKKDALSLANNSAVNMSSRDDQVKFLNALYIEKPNSEAGIQALLNMAKIEEERFEFEKSARLYIAFLKKSTSKNSKVSLSEKNLIRKKVVLFAWIVSEESTSLLRDVLGDRKSVCVSSIRKECTRLSPYLDMYSSSISKNIRLNAVRQVQNKKQSNRAIWATLALKDYSGLTYSQKKQALIALNAYWSNLDIHTRFSLLPVLIASQPDLVRHQRELTEKNSKLINSEKSILKRMSTLKSFEEFALLVSELPVSSIRLAALREIAIAYHNFGKELSNLDAQGKNAQFIAELSQVAKSKSQMLEGQEDEIKKNHSIKLSASVLDEIEPKAGWNGSDDDRSRPHSIYRSKWVDAMDDKRWNAVGFYMSEAEKSGGIAADVASIARVLSFKSVGANSEAYFARQEACRNQSSRTKLWPACKNASGVLVGSRSQ